MVKETLVLFKYFPIKLLSDVECNIFTNNSEREFLNKACKEGAPSKNKHKKAPLIRLFPHFIQIRHFHQNKEHLGHNCSYQGHKTTL
jgi:hypothetical protein